MALALPKPLKIDDGNSKGFTIKGDGDVTMPS
jgi:hypothetical protein